MNFRSFLILSFLGFLVLGSGCAVLQEMGDDTSGRHYTSKSFSLPPGSTDSVTFNVNTQGSISASLSTRGLASSESGSIDSMMMALQSPGDVTIAQSEGNPHERLKLRYRVPRSEREGVWKVTLTNKSERTISGTLKVYYPYEDTAGRTTSSDTTAQQGGTSQPYPESYPPTSQDSGSGSGGGYGGDYGSGQTTSSGGYGDGGYGSRSQTTSSGGYGNEPPPPSSSGGYGSGSGGGYSNGGQQAPSSQTTSSGYGTAPAPASQPPAQTQQTPQASPQRKILVVNPSVLRAVAVKPVKYGIKLDTFGLVGRDRRDKFYFNVRREGTIDVYVRWQRDLKLAVILNGPTQNNALARKDGKGNIHLQYHVKKSDIVAGRQWKITIARFDEVEPTMDLSRAISSVAPVNGNLQIRYPKE